MSTSQSDRNPGSFIATLDTKYDDDQLAAIATRVITSNFPQNPNSIDTTLHVLGINHTGDNLDIAIVAIDKDKVQALIGQPHVAKLLQDQVKELWQRIQRAVEGKEIDKAWDASQEISPDLKELLEKTLIGTTSFGHSPKTQSPDWLLPYDFIASLKALYVALDEDALDSKEMRQGAVKVEASGRNISIGTSGLQSFEDEIISISTGEEIASDLALAIRRADTSATDSFPR